MRLITKREVLEAANRGEGCLGKAADDEPVFVLVAKDMFAPKTVAGWLAELAEFSEGRGGKIDDAMAVLNAMRDWQDRNNLMKVPD